MHAQRATEAENITHHFVHEGDRHVRQKVKDVDCGPGTLPEQVGGIGPLVRSRALHHDAALRHAEATLFVPLFENGDGLFITLRYTSILVQALSKHRADRLRQLKEPWYDSRTRQYDLSVLKHKATPALTKDHEVWVLGPNRSA